MATPKKFVSIRVLKDGGLRIVPKKESHEVEPPDEQQVVTRTEGFVSGIKEDFTGATSAAIETANIENNSALAAEVTVSCVKSSDAVKDKPSSTVTVGKGKNSLTFRITAKDKLKSTSANTARDKVSTPATATALEEAISTLTVLEVTEDRNESALEGEEVAGNITAATDVQSNCSTLRAVRPPKDKGVRIVATKNDNSTLAVDGCSTLQQYYSTVTMDTDISEVYFATESNGELLPELYDHDYCGSSIVSNVSLTQTSEGSGEPFPSGPENSSSLKSALDATDTSTIGANEGPPEEMEAEKIAVQPQFKCPECNAIYSEQNKLIDHLVDEHSNANEMPYLCDFCEKRFPDVRIFQKHLKTHEGKEPNQCGECQQMCASRAGLKRHILLSHKQFKSKTSKLHTCQACRTSFKTLTSLRAHMCVPTKIFQEKLVDDTMIEKEEKKKLLKRKRRRELFIEDDNKRIVLSSNFAVNYSAKMTIDFKCKDCNTFFANEDKLNAHLTNGARAGLHCIICSKNFVTLDCLSNHTRMHVKVNEDPVESLNEGESFQCVNCNGSFDNSESLTEHTCGGQSNVEYWTAEDLDQILGGEGFQVEVDNDESIDSGTVQEEILADSGRSQNVVLIDAANIENEFRTQNTEITKEPKGKIFECANCHESFVDSKCLTDHSCEPAQSVVNEEELVTESGRKVYLCATCQKTFSTYKSLTNHVCKAEDNVTCKICFTKIKYFCNLKRHMLKHIGEKNFKCSKCSKAFAVKDGLRVHLNTHNNDPIKCETCNETFPNRRSFLVHKCPNNGDVIFDCTECPKSYTSIQCLKEHFYIHSYTEPAICNICNKPVLNLTRHLEIHAGRLIFTCDLCNKTFTSRFGLKKHKYTHRETESITCETCNLDFALRKTFMKHDCSETGEKSYQCTKCSRSFVTSQFLKLHLCAYTKPVACSVCNRKCSSTYKLKRHMRLHNGEQKPYPCNLCSKSFDYASNVKKHMRSHLNSKPRKPVTCDLCRVTFPSHKAYSRHSCVKTVDGRYQCTKCPKSLVNRSHLKQHLDYHANPDIFKCKLCNMQLSTAANLRRHLHRHTGARPFACDMCNKAFSTGYGLKAHMDVHTGIKPFQCDVCAMRFRSKNEMRAHFRIHTGEKPYKCEYCDKWFAHIGNRRLHMRQHTGERPFQCDICYKRFYGHSELRTHRVHNHAGEKKHECKFCKKRFFSPGTLRNHLPTHTGERAYNCSICNKDFKCPSNLSRHRLTHTGEKRNQCELCKRCFSSRVKLSEHNCGSPDEKVFRCKDCKNQFRTRVELTNHSCTHIGSEQFKCDRCQQSFHSRGKLADHYCANSDNNVFKCNDCKIQFATRIELISHRRTHIDSKQFKCHVCNKCFHNRSILDLHMNNHPSTWSNYNVNDISYVEDLPLADMLGVEVNTGYESAANIDSFQSNAKNQSADGKFQCDFCNKCFGNELAFTKHRRTHSGKNPFKCVFCGKGFPEHDTLTNHLLTHIGR